METIEIHGKQYVTVSERVKYFRKTYPEWSLKTTALEASDVCAVFKAEIIDQDGVVRSTGHAYEMPGTSHINKFSHVENCETSAVGRCLGLFGIGLDGGIASLDEIINAGTSEYIYKLLRKSSVSDEDRQKVEDNLSTMTTRDAEQVIKFLLAHQLDPIESGMGYNQKDINKRLDKIMDDPKK